MSSVLVIDDDALFRGLMKMAFAKGGHDILVAEDGEAGVTLAKESIPDIIVTDMNMPRMTGWEVLDALKAFPGTKDIPIVVLSAHQTSQDKDEAHIRGCAGYLVKPVSVPDLLARVEEILADSTGRD